MVERAREIGADQPSEAFDQIIGEMGRRKPQDDDAAS
jgi:hypothetical protein